jgi:CheY-like chemotaxis protein
MKILEPTAGNEVFTATLTLPIQKPVEVLVVDDNADTRRLYELYLKGTNYHFIGAASSEQALALAEKHRPDIVILDVMMPHQDGWEFLGQLREHPDTRGIPIIVSTILPQEHLALALGAAGFLHKPVNRTTLLAALHRQLELLQTEHP